MQQSHALRGHTMDVTSLAISRNDRCTTHPHAVCSELAFSLRVRLICLSACSHS